MSINISSILVKVNAYVDAYEKTDSSNTDALRIQIHKLSELVMSDFHMSTEPRVQLRLVYCKAHYHYISGEFMQAYRVFKSVTQDFSDPDDLRLLAKLYRMMAFMSFVKGSFVSAIELSYKALAFAKESNDILEQTAILMNLGIVYSIGSSREKQMTYFKQALQLAKTHTLKTIERQIYNNIAYTYYLNKDYEQASKYVAEAEILYPFNDLSTQHIALLLTKVSLLHHDRNLQEAALLLARVELHSKLKQDKAIWLDWHIEKARHYKLCGDSTRSGELLETAYKLAQAYQMNNYLLTLLDLLTECAKSKGKLDEALVYQKERRALVDKINQEKDDYQYMLMQVQYEIDDMTRRVSELSSELKDTQESSIYALATLAEYRDSVTGKHILRTIHYMEAFINLVNTKTNLPHFSEGERHSCARSAALHDIGKVGITDLILRKPSKLTEEEFEQIKLHTTIGRDALATTKDILGNRNFLELAMRIAYTHHEKWDGTGYPEGLKGEAIPIEGRMMAIVDVYDALISKRPYKEPYSHHKSIQMLLEGRGTHFDPVLLDLFVANQNEFYKVAYQLMDSPQERESLGMIDY